MSEITYTEKNDRSSPFTEDLKETFLKCGCIAYFIIGLCFSLATISKELDPNQDNGLGLLKWFICLMIICYITNFLLIMYNRYKAMISDKTINVRKNLLLYFFISPLMVLVTIYIVLQIIKSAKFPDNTENMTTALTFFYFIFIVSLMILIVDENRLKAARQRHCYTFLNKASITITCVGIVVSMMWLLTGDQIFIFKDLCRRFYNVTFYSNNSTSNIENIALFSIIEKIRCVLFPTHMAFLALSIGYLLGSFIGQFKQNKHEGTDFNSFEIQNRVWKKLVTSHFVGVAIIIISLIGLPFIHDQERKSANYIVFYSLQSVSYFLGILLSLIQIKEIRYWPKTNGNINVAVHRILLYIGVFGQVVFIINTTSTAVQTLYNLGGSYEHRTEIQEKEYLLAILSECLSLLTLMLLAIQVTLQGAVVHLSLLTKPKTPMVESTARYICPSVGLLCLNISCVFIALYMAPLPTAYEFKSISTNFLQRGLHVISISFSLIHRLHGGFFFIVLLGKVQELSIN